MSFELLQCETGPAAQKRGADIVSEPMPSEQQEEAAENQPNSEADDLLWQEILRESPVEWSESLPGMEEMLMTIDPPLELSGNEYSNKLTRKDITRINQLAQMSPEELIEKIKTMEREIYQLSKSEASEMTRARLLGIFDRHSMP